MNARLAILIAALAAALITAVMRQDAAYHDFADQRGFGGWPNFWNVASNAAFAVAGAVGLSRLRALPGRRWEIAAFTLLFSGVLATSLGSAYYHWAPSDATLFWDRLPMAVAFMALFAILTGDGFLLAPMVAAGVASVVWWRAHDDLRFYLLVQFAPVLSIPVILWQTRASQRAAGELWIALALYVAAKILELADRPVYAAVGLSGHSLKHVAAGLSCWWLLRWMVRRAE